jgi:hypothetical protein
MCRALSSCTSLCAARGRAGLKERKLAAPTGLTVQLGIDGAVCSGERAVGDQCCVLIVALCQYWLLMSLHNDQQRRMVTSFSGKSLLKGSVLCYGKWNLWCTTAATAMQNYPTHMR